MAMASLTALTHSQAVRQSLHLHITPSPYETSSDSLFTPTSSIPILNTTLEEPGSPTSQMPDGVIFSVLCMYDYPGQGEQGLLPFKKNQILDIVKRDDTGWWAAMTEDGKVVGWIPQAFVIPLSDEMAKKLRNVREEVRVAEFEAERLYDSAPFEINLPLFDTDSANTSPSVEGHGVYMRRTIISPAPTSLDDYPTRVEEASGNSDLPQISRQRVYLRAPPSPASPMPYPPSSSRDKPTPPTPLPSNEDLIKKKRSIRRRPLMVNDDPTLKRFNSLLESQDVEAIEKLSTPNMSRSFRSMQRCHREERPQRKKETDRNKESNSLLESKDMEAIDKSSMLNISASGSLRSISRPQRKKETDRNKDLPKSPGGKPRYLQLFHEKDIDADERGNIRSATIHALIERLTTHATMIDSTKLIEYTNYTKIFLTTFRTFMTANRLFELLVDRFNMKTPKSLSDPEYKDWKTNLREPVRRRILEIFALWLENYLLLEEEPHIAQRLTDFLSTLKHPYNSTADALIKDIERLTFAFPADISTSGKQKKAWKAKVNRNDLLKLSPSALAEQLALYEHALYAKITPPECLSYAREQSGEKVLKLLDFCSTYDKLAGWVKSSVLVTDVLLKRAEIVDFWIRVAEKCRSLNNFMSMSAITVALSSTALTNLHLTFVHVKRQAQLDALHQHSTPDGGFAGQRALLTQTEGPCVPFITMYLADLLRAKGKFSEDDGRVLFYQRARSYEIISNMLKFQGRKYPIAPNDTLTAFMDMQLRGAPRDEEWFWTKSQEVQRIEVANADIRKGLEAAGF